MTIDTLYIICSNNSIKIQISYCKNEQLLENFYREEIQMPSNQRKPTVYVSASFVSFNSFSNAQMLRAPSFYFLFQNMFRINRKITIGNFSNLFING